MLLFGEANRAPLDFNEGESELVSGFNVEYGSIGFVFLFLSEYGILLYLTSLFRLVFCSSSLIGFMFLLFAVLLARGTLPRLRYDFLLQIC